MSTRKQFGLSFIVASLVLLLLAACGESATPTPTATTASTGGGPVATATPTAIPTATPTPTGQQPQYGGVIFRAYDSDHPDPYHSLAGIPGYTHSQAYNRLIEHRKPHEGQMTNLLVPALATEWSVDETSTKWTFKLREGVAWHDGETFDAEDVVATFERVLSGDVLVSRYSPVLRTIINDMEIVDPQTVIIDTGEPNAVVLPWLSNWDMPIVPEHLIRDPNPGPDDTGWRWLQPRVVDPDFGKGTGTLGIGTGPYIMTNWEAEGHYTHKRNPNYWLFDEFGNRLPYLDGLNDVFVTDLNRQWAMFATNNIQELHGRSGLSKTKADVLCARTTTPCRVQFHEHGYFYFVFNDRIPPFDNPKMIEAAKWAMDMNKGIDLQFGQSRNDTKWMHLAFPEANITNVEKYQLMPWSDPAQRSPVDIWRQKALDQIAEAGFPDGVDFGFDWYGIASRTSAGRDMYGSTYTDMQASGFNFTPTAARGLNEDFRSGKFNIAHRSCGTPLVDPTGGVAMGGLSWSATVGGRPWAWPGVDEADRLYTAANTFMDPIQRGEALKELERFYTDSELPIASFGWTEQNMTTPECVRNFRFGPGLYGLEHANTWMEEGCTRDLDKALESLEPRDLNVMQSVMWNWQ